MGQQKDLEQAIKSSVSLCLIQFQESKSYTSFLQKQAQGQKNLQFPFEELRVYLCATLPQTVNSNSSLHPSPRKSRLLRRRSKGREILEQLPDSSEKEIISFSYLQKLVDEENISAFQTVTAAHSFDTLINFRDPLTQIHIIEYAATKGAASFLLQILEPEYFESSIFFRNSQLSSSLETTTPLFQFLISDVKSDVLPIEQLKFLLKQLLLLAGNPNVKMENSEECDTALHYCCRYGKGFMISLLIEGEASVNERNSSTFWPMDLFLRRLIQPNIGNEERQELGSENPADILMSLLPNRNEILSKEVESSEEGISKEEEDLKKRGAYWADKLAKAGKWDLFSVIQKFQIDFGETCLFFPPFHPTVLSEFPEKNTQPKAKSLQLLKYASLESLVSELMNCFVKSSCEAEAFVDIILFAVPFFLDPVVFLTALLTCQATNPLARLEVKKILTKWQKHPEFEEDWESHAMHAVYQDFHKDSLPPSPPPYRQEGEAPSLLSKRPLPSPKPSLPSLPLLSTFKGSTLTCQHTLKDTLEILYLPSSVIGSHLTMWNHALHQKIGGREILEHVLGNEVKKGRKEKRGQYIHEAIAFFNNLTTWTVHSILSCFSVQTRVRVMESFIHIAHYCLEQRNFGSALSIELGLSCPEVERLKVTLHLLSESAQTKLLSLKQVLSYNGSFKAYRKAVLSRDELGVSYLGLLFRDLLLSHEGYPNKEKDLYSVQKWRKMHLILSQYHMNLHESPMTLPVDKNIAQKLANDISYYVRQRWTFHEKDLMKRSKQLEHEQKEIMDNSDLYLLEKGCSLSLNIETPLKSPRAMSPRTAIENVCSFDREKIPRHMSFGGITNKKETKETKEANEGNDSSVHVFGVSSSPAASSSSKLSVRKGTKVHKKQKSSSSSDLNLPDRLSGDRHLLLILGYVFECEEDLLLSKRENRRKEFARFKSEIKILRGTFKNLTYDHLFRQFGYCTEKEMIGIDEGIKERKKNMERVDCPPLAFLKSLENFMPTTISFLSLQVDHSLKSLLKKATKSPVSVALTHAFLVYRVTTYIHNSVKENCTRKKCPVMLGAKANPFPPFWKGDDGKKLLILSAPDYIASLHRWVYIQMTEDPKSSEEEERESSSKTFLRRLLSMCIRVLLHVYSQHSDAVSAFRARKEVNDEVFWGFGDEFQSEEEGREPLFKR